MKIRIQIPEEIARTTGRKSYVNEYIDDILMWGMETELDVELYKTYCVPKDGHWSNTDMFAVFTVEPVGAMMFTLRWGALQHKNKQLKEKS